MVLWRQRFESGQNWPERVRYCVGQLERGDGGKEHIQGYVELRKPCKMGPLKRELSGTAHWEYRRGTRDQARDYARKDDTRLAGPWEYGEWGAGGTGARNDLGCVAERISGGASVEELAEEFPIEFIKFHRGIEKLVALKQPNRDPERAHTAVLYYGPPGCGKTSSVSREYPGAYWKPTRSKWFDGYNGQDIIVYDDFNRGWFSIDDFCRVVDRYQCNVEVKGGHARLANTVSVFTTNTLPSKWYNFEKYGLWRLTALTRRFASFRAFYENGKYEEFENYGDFVKFLDDPGSREKEFNFSQLPPAPAAIAASYVKSSEDLEKIKEY